jgi:hypothetical protein
VVVTNGAWSAFVPAATTERPAQCRNVFLGSFDGE